jgi:hypothetical protein
MEHDPLDLAAERLRKEEAQEAASLEATAAAEDLEMVMEYAFGRRFVWRLLEQAGVYRASFAGEATHQTAFLEGQRNGGLRLLHQIFETCPGSYALMMKEAHERKQRQPDPDHRDGRD